MLAPIDSDRFLSALLLRLAVTGGGRPPACPIRDRGRRSARHRSRRRIVAVPAGRVLGGDAQSPQSNNGCPRAAQVMICNPPGGPPGAGLGVGVGRLKLALKKTVTLSERDRASDTTSITLPNSDPAGRRRLGR